MAGTPHREATTSSLHPRHDTGFVVQFLNSTSHPDPAIVMIHMESCLINGDHMSPMSRCPTLVSPRPLQVALAVNQGEQGFPQGSSGIITRTNRMFLHQRDRNLDIKGILPLNPEGGCWLGTPCIAQLYECAVFADRCLLGTSWARSGSWSSRFSIPIHDFADLSLSDAIKFGNLHIFHALSTKGNDPMTHMRWQLADHCFSSKCAKFQVAASHRSREML